MEGGGEGGRPQPLTLSLPSLPPPPPQARRQKKGQERESAKNFRLSPSCAVAFLANCPRPRLFLLTHSLSLPLLNLFGPSPLSPPPSYDFECLDFEARDKILSSPFPPPPSLSSLVPPPFEKTRRNATKAQIPARYSLSLLHDVFLSLFLEETEREETRNIFSQKFKEGEKGDRTKQVGGEKERETIRPCL